MKNPNPFLLAILSGCLLAVSWPEFGSISPLLFVAFCPLLYIQHNFQDKARGTLLITRMGFVTFFTFNIITTYWLLCVEGSYMTIFLSGFMPSIINGSVMLLPFWLFHLTKKRLGNWMGFISFPIFWLGMEFFQLRWDLTWTWLELGNAFAAHVNWVQWYEYTGVHGGTLWILLGNLLIFNIFLEWRKTNKFPTKNYLKIVGLILIPVAISYIILHNTQEIGSSAEVVVVQPNVDPYDEKFTISFDQQLQDMLLQAKSAQTAKTQLLVFPETALQERSNVYLDDSGNLQLIGMWENTIDSSVSLKMLREYMSPHPSLNIIIGLSSDSLYPPNTPPTPTARPLGNSGLLYDSFNTGMLVSKDTVHLYHKSKLVPAVERMPFVTVLRPLLGDAAINFGGTSGGVGTQEYRSVFKCSDSKIKAAPVICYESLYGEYVGEYVTNGANLITIITNDGWWSNSPGHKHHLAYARLRAIEHRRDIARSANTGISAFINQKGEITQQTSYGVPAAIKGNVQLNEKITFYSRNGDYLARSSFCLSVGLCFWLIFFRISQKFFPSLRNN